MGSIYIITPCRNSCETISQTIDSVLSQDTGCHIFYHIQDGLSDDNTQKILEYYENKIQNDIELNKKITFTWDSVRDDGMYDAISIAVKRLSIPDNCFMGWINADDLLSPICFRTLEKLALSNVDWIGGPPLMQDMQGNVLGQGMRGMYPRYFLQHGLCDGMHWNFLQQEGTFFKKRLWDIVGGFTAKLRLAGDWDLWRRMAAIADYIQTPWPMGIFRQRPGQLSQDLSAYMRETEGIVSLKIRRKALRRVIKKMHNLPVHEIGENGEKLSVSESVLKLNPRTVFKMQCCAMGFYRLPQLHQKALAIFDMFWGK